MRFLAGVVSLAVFSVVSSAALAATEDDQRACMGASGDAAIAGCTKVIEDQRLRPIHAYAYYNRGTEYTDKGNCDRAIADYSAAIRIGFKSASESASAYYNRGLCYQGKGDRKRAIADYRKTLEIKPDHAKARAELRDLGITP